MKTASFSEAELERYSLTPPITPFDLPRSGINNAIIGVHTGAGDYVLKSFEVPHGVEGLCYEHRLLQWLETQPTSFAVPAPVTTRSGETWYEIPEGCKVLLPFFKGQRPNDDDPAHVEAVGSVLGELHATLCQYSTKPRPGLMVFGDLDSIHPAIQNVADLTPEKMGWEVTKLTDTLCAEWRTELEGIEGFLEHTYPHLPVQVIHGDFGLGNTLYNQNHVSAILDFEFALPDVRIIDFAAGLTLMMLKVAPGDVLARASHFYSGYRCWIDLTGEEIGAMAEVMTLCVVVSAIWWLGRELEERRGQPGLERLIRLRDLKSWLKVYGASFKEMLVCG